MAALPIMATFEQVRGHRYRQRTVVLLIAIGGMLIFFLISRCCQLLRWLFLGDRVFYLEFLLNLSPLHALFLLDILIISAPRLIISLIGQCGLLYSHLVLLRDLPEAVYDDAEILIEHEGAHREHHVLEGDHIKSQHQTRCVHIKVTLDELNPEVGALVQRVPLFEKHQDPNYANN